MKLCIPVLENTGLQAATEPHFPHASLLLVFDTESRQHHHIDIHRCEELPAEQTMIDAILCASINRHTLRSLVDQNIQVFGTEAQTAIEAITQFENGELEAVAIAGRHAHGDCDCQKEGSVQERECCGGHGHAEDHECCGGQGHGGGDHECCGGGQHNGGCGCQNTQD